jgi:hypothetical protein
MFSEQRPVFSDNDSLTNLCSLIILLSGFRSARSWGGQRRHLTGFLDLTECKKNPRIEINRSGDIPFLSSRSMTHFSATNITPNAQAGLLTLGSSYLPRLPIQRILDSDIFAVFVPDYSGGPAPDLHGIPSHARIKAPEQFLVSFTTSQK